MKKFSLLWITCILALVSGAQTGSVGVPYHLTISPLNNSWLLLNPLDAQVVDGRFVESKSLRLTQTTISFRDFRLAVPSNATITGIEVRVWRKKKGATTVKDVTVALLKPVNETEASGYGPNLASPDPWPDKVGMAFYAFPPTALFRANEPFRWMPADVNHPAFALFLGLSFGTGRGAAAQIDKVQLTVLYTQGGTTMRQSETLRPAPSIGLRQFGNRFRVTLADEGAYRFTVRDRSGVVLQQTDISGKEVMVPLNARCRGYLIVTVEGKGQSQTVQAFVQ